MAIVLATFILAVQEILYVLYFVLLFMNDQAELRSLVAKDACYTPQGLSQSSLCKSRRDRNNEQRALLFSLLFLKIIEVD